MEKQNYIAPEIEVLDIQIEKGFASSSGRDLPGFGNGGHLGDDF